MYFTISIVLALLLINHFHIYSAQNLLYDTETNMLLHTLTSNRHQLLLYVQNLPLTVI